MKVEVDLTDTDCLVLKSAIDQLPFGVAKNHQHLGDLESGFAQFTAEELNVLGPALGELPLKVSMNLWAKLKAAANEQLPPEQPQPETNGKPEEPVDLPVTEEV